MDQREGGSRDVAHRRPALPVNADAQPLSLAVGDAHRVSALSILPPRARACYVFAHGAGAGMAHPFMQSFAMGLANADIATLRFQFPYMERKSGRPDPPALCHATVRAAVEQANLLTPGLPLIAGGRSFGGRMSSQAQALSPLPRVAGLAFLGFPLHPAGKPADERAQHLFDTAVPLLFLQGDHDELAHSHLLQTLVARLGPRATLRLIQGADHSYRVPARSGCKPAQVLAELIQAMRDWIESIITQS
jgi:predicted alpha/beta-hydrolase family hydrolase